MVVLSFIASKKTFEVHGNSENFFNVKWAHLLFVPVVLLSTLVVALFLLTRWPKPRRLKPRRAGTFRSALVPTNVDTIVIGSGSGGCTCANLLAQSGQRVLLLERHEKTGGCTHSFSEHNCEWDTGLHYTSKCMSQKTERSGAIMDFMTRGIQKWKPLDDPYDEVIFQSDMDFTRDGVQHPSAYQFFTGKDKTVNAILAKIDPNNSELRKRCITYLDFCLELNGGFGFLGISRILPSCLQFLVKKKVERLMAFASMTVRDAQYAILNRGYTADDLLKKGCPTAPNGTDPDLSIRRLKAVLTHPVGDYGVQPRYASVAAHGVTMSHYIGGAAYTVGPTQNISLNTSSLLREYGGEVLVDADVKEIIIENGRAVGVRVRNTKALAKYASESGEMENLPLTEIRAKNVVCATSIYNLYNKLLPQDMPLVKKFQRNATVRQSDGHIFLFAKIKGDATEIGLPTNNLWYFNGYDLDSAFDEYYANPTQVRPPTAYIGFPCTKDPTWRERYPRVSNCILIADGLYEWFERWAEKPCRNRGDDYVDFKNKLAKHLLDILYEIVPQVKGEVEYHHLGTPLSEVTWLSSYKGGSYGTRCDTAMFSGANRRWTTTPHTTVPGLFLAGCDAFLPSVVGAMYGGMLGASAVLGHWGTVRLGFAILSHLGKGLMDENPELSWFQSLRMAVGIFVNS